MKVLHQSVIAQAPDRFYGWPANCGMWCWPTEGSDKGEILVSFIEGYHLVDHGTSHAIDTERKRQTIFARSFDGGESWEIERPALPWPDVDALNEIAPDEIGDEQWIPSLKEPINFTAPGFAMMFQNMSTHYPSRSWFYFTYDKGHTWQGPFRVPTMFRATSLRTDYIVLDDKTLFVGFTASRPDGFEGTIYAAKLCDGGLRWEIHGKLGEEPGNSFHIMPSTCRMPDGSYISATRFCDKAGVRRLEIFRSADDGQNWEMIATIGDSCSPTAGNPPAMCLLDDGRLLVVYGKRDTPHGMIAHASSDGGFTWSQPFYLRQDSECADLGYPRMIIRPDGMAVTAYYYSPTEDSLRFVGCTVFDPAEE